MKKQIFKTISCVLILAICINSIAGDVYPATKCLRPIASGIDPRQEAVKAAVVSGEDTGNPHAFSENDLAGLKQPDKKEVKRKRLRIVYKVLGALFILAPVAYRYAIPVIARTKERILEKAADPFSFKDVFYLKAVGWMLVIYMALKLFKISPLKKIVEATKIKAKDYGLDIDGEAQEASIWSIGAFWSINRAADILLRGLSLTLALQFQHPLLWILAGLIWVFAGGFVRYFTMKFMYLKTQNPTYNAIAKWCWLPLVGSFVPFKTMGASSKVIARWFLIDPAKKLLFGNKDGTAPSPLSLRFVITVSAIVGVLFIALMFVPQLPLQALFSSAMLPHFLSYTNLRTVLNFIVFVPLGEFLGQLLELRFQGNFKPGIKDFKWWKIIATFIFVGIFIGWFLPFTYSIWRASLLPKALYGVADQMTTCVLVVPAWFSLIHIVLHKLLYGNFKDELKNDTPFNILRKSLKEKAPLLWKLMIFTFIFWALALAIIFKLPIAEAFQDNLIALLQPYFAIYFSLIGNKMADTESAIKMKNWAKILLPIALLYNFGFLMLHIGNATIPMVAVLYVLLGALLYLPVLFRGFSRIEPEIILKPVTTTADETPLSLRGAPESALDATKQSKFRFASPPARNDENTKSSSSGQSDTRLFPISTKTKWRLSLLLAASLGIFFYPKFFKRDSEIKGEGPSSPPAAQAEPEKDTPEPKEKTTPKEDIPSIPFESIARVHRLLKTLDQNELRKVHNSRVVLSLISRPAQTRLINRLLDEKRLRIAKASKKDLAAIYQIFRGDYMAEDEEVHCNAITLGRTGDNGNVYTVVFNEETFSDPALFVNALIHEFMGHVVNEEAHGIPDLYIEEETRAIETETEFMMAMLKHRVAIIESMKTSGLQGEGLEFIEDALDLERLQRMLNKRLRELHNFSKANSPKTSSSGLAGAQALNFDRVVQDHLAAFLQNMQPDSAVTIAPEAPLPAPLGELSDMMHERYQDELFGLGLESTDWKIRAEGGALIIESQDSRRFLCNSAMKEISQWLDDREIEHCIIELKVPSSPGLREMLVDDSMMHVKMINNFMIIARVDGEDYIIGATPFDRAVLKTFGGAKLDDRPLVFKYMMNPLASRRTVGKDELRSMEEPAPLGSGGLFMRSFVLEEKSFGIGAYAGLEDTEDGRQVIVHVNLGESKAEGLDIKGQELLNIKANIPVDYLRAIMLTYENKDVGRKAVFDFLVMHGFIDELNKLGHEQGEGQSTTALADSARKLLIDLIYASCVALEGSGKQVMSDELIAALEGRPIEGSKLLDAAREFSQKSSSSGAVTLNDLDLSKAVFESDMNYILFYKAPHKETGEIYVIKVFKEPPGGDHSVNKGLIEYLIWLQEEYPDLVRDGIMPPVHSMGECFVRGNRISNSKFFRSKGPLYYMITEFIEGPTLWHISSREILGRELNWDPDDDRELLTLKFKVKLLIDAAEAVLKCHKRGLVVKDIKAANIIIKADLSGACIVDFKGAVPIGYDWTAGPQNIPRAIIAILTRSHSEDFGRLEALPARSKELFTEQWDIHNFGITMFSLIDPIAFKEIMDESDSPEEIRDSIRGYLDSQLAGDTELGASYFVRVLLDLYRIISECIKVDRAERTDNMEELIEELGGCLLCLNIIEGQAERAKAKERQRKIDLAILSAA